MIITNKKTKFIIIKSEPKKNKTYFKITKLGKDSDYNSNNKRGKKRKIFTIIKDLSKRKELLEFDFFIEMRDKLAFQSNNLRVNKLSNDNANGSYSDLELNFSEMTKIETNHNNKRIFNNNCSYANKNTISDI